MTQTETQNIMLLDKLMQGFKITPARAWNWIGCSKASTRIGEIKKHGFPIQKNRIKVKNRYGKDVHVMQYSL